MLVAALAQVECGEVEAEHLHRADQRRQSRRDQRLGMVALQRGLDGAQVGQQLLGRAVGVLRRDGMAQRFGAGQPVQRGGQAGVHAGECAAVGLVQAVGVLVGAALGQPLHLGGHAGQAQRDRQLGAQLVQLGQVVAQRHLALALHRAAQRGGADVGVAVAVAADPVAHAQEAGQWLARQMLLQLGIELGDLAQEGGLVVGQRVLDLVGHRQLGVAQHARLPELGDAGAQQRFGLAQLALATCMSGAVARLQQRRNGALGIQDALALHLGRVGREHRRDEAAPQHAGDLVRADAGFVQMLQAVGQRARLQAAGAFVDVAAADVVAVLGDVGQVREVAERADHADRLLAGQALEQLVKALARLFVVLVAIGHRQLADALDQLIGLAAFLLADHVAEDAPEQPDVGDQRFVLVDLGVGLGHGGGAGGGGS
mmetsp:Transcript_1093/g.2954  ORF Transcript_1093/g.2954 Transcript_1093/m.2954 type:complete len:428 (+) Transcript_1093:4161-5444(+)